LLGIQVQPQICLKDCASLNTTLPVSFLTFLSVLSWCGAPPGEGAAAGLSASKEGIDISIKGAQRFRAAVAVPGTWLVELCGCIEHVRECPRAANESSAPHVGDVPGSLLLLLLLLLRRGRHASRQDQELDEVGTHAGEVRQRRASSTVCVL